MSVSVSIYILRHASLFSSYSDNLPAMFFNSRVHSSVENLFERIQIILLNCFREKSVFNEGELELLYEMFKKEQVAGFFWSQLQPEEAFDRNDPFCVQSKINLLRYSALMKTLSPWCCNSMGKNCYGYTYPKLQILQDDLKFAMIQNLQLPCNFFDYFLTLAKLCSLSGSPQ